MTNRVQSLSFLFNVNTCLFDKCVISRGTKRDHKIVALLINISSISIDSMNAVWCLLHSISWRSDRKKYKSSFRFNRLLFKYYLNKYLVIGICIFVFLSNKNWSPDCIHQIVTNKNDIVYIGFKNIEHMFLCLFLYMVGKYLFCLNDTYMRWTISV
jgi:hypothetical protein